MKSYGHCLWRAWPNCLTSHFFETPGNVQEVQPGSDVAAELVAGHVYQIYTPSYEMDDVADAVLAELDGKNEQ